MDAVTIHTMRLVMEPLALVANMSQGNIVKCL